MGSLGFQRKATPLQGYPAFFGMNLAPKEGRRVLEDARIRTDMVGVESQQVIPGGEFHGDALVLGPFECKPQRTLEYWLAVQPSLIPGRTHGANFQSSGGADAKMSAKKDIGIGNGRLRRPKGAFHPMVVPVWP